MNNPPQQSRQPLVVIQRNPKSGSGCRRNELRKLSSRLRRFGFVVRMFSDRQKLDLYMASIPESRDLKCIVAAGGDGTVADLVNRHPGVAIAILPLGTENLLARYIQQPCCGHALAETIHRGHLRTLDSAKANGLRFLLMLSVGLDAEVVDSVHSARVGNLHRLSYARPCLRAFLSSRPVTYTATSADGSQVISGSHVIVTNVPMYGFGLPFAPDAQPDDQQLDVRAFHGQTRWSVFWHAVRLKLGLPINAGEVSRFTDKAVTIRCETPGSDRHSQCDGDPGPSLPLLIEIEPASLKLIVP